MNNYYNLLKDKIHSSILCLERLITRDNFEIYENTCTEILGAF